MDDRQLKDATARLRKIEGQIGDLTAKQRAAEVKLKTQVETASKLARQRGELISELATVNDEEQAKAIHKKLDLLDPQVTKATRLIESHERALKDIASETATLTNDRNKLNELVAAENNARAFAQWQADMQANFEAARAAMATARITLGKLTTEAAAGVERFKGAASNWAGSRFEEFEHREANPDTLLGLRDGHAVVSEHPHQHLADGEERLTGRCRETWWKWALQVVRDHRRLAAFLFVEIRNNFGCARALRTQANNRRCSKKAACRAKCYDLTERG